MNSKKHKIICFAGADFDLPYLTNRQQIMKRVAQKHFVLYIEPRILIWRNLSKFFKSWKKFFGVEKRTENFFLHSQFNFLPWSREISLIDKFNYFINLWLIKKVLRQMNFYKPILWIYDTEAASYLGKLREDFILYDCVDEHKFQKGVDRNPRRTEKEEKQVLSRANAVAVTSQNLYRTKSPFNKNTHLVPNVGDYESFRKDKLAKLPLPHDLKDIPYPILGSVGAIDAYKYDLNLVYEVASNNPSWQFVFIGPIALADKKTDISNLQKLSNVHFLGPKSHQEVPAYVKAFDICLIPYVKNPYNKYSFPLKFWEFMATGKPLIVSGLPELEKFSHLVEIVDDAASFTQAVRGILKGEEKEKISKRIALAKENTWEKRVEQLLKLLPR